MEDLEARARAIIGPVSFPGLTSAYNLGWIPGDDPSGELLDALRFSDTANHRSILVTTRDLLAGWIGRRAKIPVDPLVEIGHEDRLTWAFWHEAHIYPFADVRTKTSLPREVFLAQMVGISNDIPDLAEWVVLGVEHGGRVYLILAKAAVVIPAPGSCGAAWTDEPHRRCYDATVSAHPQFEKIVGQMRGLALLVSR